MRIEDQEFLANLVVLGIGDFDVILGIDRLFIYRATMDCYKKEVRGGKERKGRKKRKKAWFRSFKTSRLGKHPNSTIICVFF